MAKNMKIDGLTETISMLNRVKDEQVPRVASKELTSIMYKVRESLQKHMKGVFHNPVRYTLSAIMVWRATPEKLKASVFVRDQATKGTPPIKYLRPNIEGGQRNQKRSEKLLANLGIIESDEYLVPYKVKLNQYGNVSTGVIQRVLSGLRAQSDDYQNSPARGGTYRGTRRGRKVQRRYFAVRRHGTSIIFESTARRKVPLFLSRRKAVYQPIFRFYEVAESKISKEQDDLRRALEKFGW